MEAVREKMKQARRFLKYGEVKMTMEKFNLDRERAYPISRGRLSPYDNELPFCEALLALVKPRMELMKAR